jgi:hypothetical protein
MVDILVVLVLWWIWPPLVLVFFVAAVWADMAAAERHRKWAFVRNQAADWTAE